MKEMKDEGSQKLPSNATRSVGSLDSGVMAAVLKLPFWVFFHVQRKAGHRVS
jgi:hypothetical protein